MYELLLLYNLNSGPTLEDVWPDSDRRHYCYPLLLLVDDIEGPTRYLFCSEVIFLSCPLNHHTEIIQDKGPACGPAS